MLINIHKNTRIDSGWIIAKVCPACGSSMNELGVIENANPTQYDTKVFECVHCLIRTTIKLDEMLKQR